MASYPPGSFTKNFAWARRPPGLKALYDAIRSGFRGSMAPVSRDNFRRYSGIADSDRQLIPLNFFLHNTIVQGANVVSIDELVRHALSSGHSRRLIT